MKAILNHSVLNEDSLLQLNWFMSVVEKSEYPVELITALYENNLLPNGLDGTDCEIIIKPDKVEFCEKTGNENRVIAYTTVYQIDI